ncbi:Proto-oncogene c-Rel [Holothuria leucospilota]|uniref:Proto-oncogene c-Rel n=1 Tax=Holothuria leucospilota TaxID=206669 RepID=A0A9Q1CIN5_HOLLE|nr:Proto-oncogene c-Rel [Holothuria leucospilota]
MAGDNRAPKPKDHRFRYPCEGRTAGALLGVRSTQKKKTCPRSEAYMKIYHISFQVQNLTTRAMIVGSLVTNKGDKPHPFRLVGNSCEDGIVKKIVDAKSPKAKFESWAFSV